METHRVDEEEGVGEDGEHILDTILNLLLAGNTGRVDIIDTGANLVRVAIVLKCSEQLHVALGSLNGNDVGIKTLDGGEDIVKIRVAEMGVSLELIGDTGSRELEGVNSPLEVGIPVSAAERKLHGKSQQSSTSLEWEA